MTIFSALIDTLIAAPPGRRDAIEQLIRDAFVRPRAVLALDMSGFSLSVRRDGILPCLCQIRRMQKLTVPIVAAHGGELIKHEADNLLAVFDDPEQATQAALAMIQATAREPEDSESALRFSIGIDYGDILILDGVDCFGDAVNLAHKLGEDIARPNEVLITRTVREKLKDGSRFVTRETLVSLSGLDVVAYQVIHANHTPAF